MWHFKIKGVLIIVGLSILTWQSKSQCVPDSLIRNYQIRPDSHLQPCAEIGNLFNAVLSFDFSQDAFLPEISRKLIFDSIAGLPKGITYEFDKPDRTYWNEIEGCITFSGTTNDVPDRYYICIYVTQHTYDMNAPTIVWSGELISAVNYSIHIMDSFGIHYNSISRPFFDVIGIGNQCDHLVLDSINSNADCANIATTSVRNPENQNHFISAFPNPTNELLSFYFGHFIGNCEIQIFNTFGQMVLQSKNNYGVKIDLRVSNLSEGIYIYRLVFYGSHLQMGKFIVN